MKQYFAYIRVSTPRQGQTGVSLPAQRDAIIRYAQKHRLSISTWFEEKQTAAKYGRPVFNQMLGSLKKHRARRIIIHKIDRSARNLKDWAKTMLRQISRLPATLVRHSRQLLARMGSSGQLASHRGRTGKSGDGPVRQSHLPVKINQSNSSHQPIQPRKSRPPPSLRIRLLIGQNAF